MDSYLCFCLALFHSVSYFFFLHWSPSSPLCTVFYSISSNIDGVLLINPSAAFAFGKFNLHLKDWLAYSGRTNRLVNSVIISLSQMTLLTWLTFLFGSLTVTLIVLLFWIYFFLLMLVFALQWLSFIQKFSSYCCLSFHWISHTQNWMPHFIA